MHGHGIILSSKLKLGKGSYINRECILDNVGEWISIGNNCAIACRVSIHTTNHNYSNSLARSGKLEPKAVIIKDGCWVGSNVVILPGTVINEGCVIASGSIVRGTLDKNYLYAGCPAKKIKKLPL